MATAEVDIPFLSSHYSIPETTLTTLSQNPTIELVNQLLESISTKAHEAEELKSDKLRLDVELENAVRSGESKVKVLKNSVEKGLAEITSLRGKLQESENTQSNLESELATLRSSTSTSESELSSLKARITSLETSNRDTLALLDSKSNAYDKLAEELSTQHKKTIELRREVSSLEQKLQAANSASSSTRFREQSLQQELELLKKNNEWFENELKTKSGEYLKFRKEKSARISELQRLNEDASSNIDALRRSENALKSRLDEVEQKYEDSLATIQQLKEEAIQATESFRIELDSSSRLAQLQQTSAETAKRRVQECQLALEKTRDDAAEEISRLRAEIETEHSDKEAAERRVAELELNVRELQSEISAARNQPMSPGQGVNGAGISTPLRPSTPVGTFSPRASRSKGGLTLTQMYSEYDKMRTLLATEQRNNHELRATMDEMVQDLESSKPEIDELRADHSRLEAAVVEMSNILDTAGKERDDATREARKWQGQVEGLEREGQILRQQLRDLSCQVKVLVMEVHLLGSDEKDYDREELEKIAQGEMDDIAQDLNETGRFITRHLTTFKNLNELQQQNVTLRRMLRDVGDKMEGEEARRKNESYQKDQEELKELRVRVQTYRDEMANLIAQTKSYIKERDTFRSMLTRRRETGESTTPFSQSLPLGAVAPVAVGDNVSQSLEAPNYTELLRKLQANFDSFRQETATDHSSLKQQVNDLTRKNSELQSEISRSSSQLAAAVQRAELLQSNFNLLKGENVELQKRHATLMENANKQDLRTQQVAEDLVEARGLVDSLRRESANLKAEKDLWKKIEKRLVEDNESLFNERARLDSLNANLQSMLNEREHLESESRRRLQSTVENLESELQTTKRKLNEEMEEAKKSTLRREYENSQNQKRIDDLVTSLSTVREELIGTKSTRDHLQSRVDELSVELKSAEERLEVLQRKPSAATATVSSGPDTEAGIAAGEGGLSREQELAFEISELKRDLELAKSDLEHAKEQVEDYKAISQSTEERLQSVTDTNEQYQEDTNRLLDEKDNKISELQKRVEEITSELAMTNDELSKLRDREADSQRRFDDQKSMLETEISRLKEQEERYTAAAQYHQQDLKAQAEIAQHAQQNYENELVKHAEAAKNLQIVRAEASQLKLEVVDLRTQAESAKNSLSREEENWNEMKARYEREITELNRRREEVVNQNTLLHQQLENITRQISTLQRDKESMPEDVDESGSSASSLEGLQEVIKFLRREKEIVDVQYHLSTQEAKRLRQQLDYTQSQLDDTRLKLEQQRRAEADTEHNTLNHKKLMDTLNELNLFRESSVTLRNQAKQAETALTEKSARVEELIQQISPLETRIRELENVVETKDGEFKLLQADRDRWQQRTQNILQKYDRIDPVEMEALKEKLAALEKERDEAVSARDELQTQITTLSAQVKQGEERIQIMRSTLTDQFKARSKELSSRIQAKQAELNTAIQEKEVIQLELDRTRGELNALKAKVPEDGAPTHTPAPAPVNQSVTDAQRPPAVQGTVPAANDSAAAEKIKALEEKIQRLEAALAEKEATIDQKVKERVDKMKQTLNNSLADYKALHKEEVEKLKASHQQELESATASACKPDGVPELSDAQARELVAKNETIRAIVRNNIKNAVTKERAAMAASKEAQVAAAPNADAIRELEKKFSEEREAIIKERDQKIGSAVELAEKRVLAKLSMTEGRARNAQAKIEVVQKAAIETPQKPVVEVWEIAKVARPAPVAAVAQPPTAQAQPPPPTPVQSPAPKPARTEHPDGAPTPTSQAQTPQPQTQVQPQPQPPQPSQTPQPQPSPSPAPAQRAPPAAAAASPKPKQATPARAPQSQQQSPQLQQQQQPPPPDKTNQAAPAQQVNQPQTASSLPNRPPQSNHPASGTGANVLRALHSGLPISRGGRGRGVPPSQQHNPFGPQATEQQGGQGQPPQQQPQQGIGRGSGLPRGGARGRGAQGRGGAQNVQTGNLPQGQGQPSPRGGRGALNAHARQFIPQGNKRARDDGGEGGDSGSGKRIRGGGAGS
ncbi:nucleoprotein TPR [Blastomyces dermatitidis ATCC 18188]|uniref:Nucleoprotein TPR n=1 Tax=Ajellomyces dermatitidis (strain ATCC 18188 / CBS 674.68) TaxID=653446 RepID=F2TQ48_AJEDA|nr:nucleoprotein TPR [Blastomyces dermatitidis ATCC 18188]